MPRNEIDGGLRGAHAGHHPPLFGTGRRLPSVALLLTLLSCASLAADETASATVKEGVDQRSGGHQTVALTGRVVWLADAVRQHHQIQTTADAAQRILALQTADNALFPILEDSRGHAFRTDERLRDIDVELLVRQYEQFPLVQVIRVYAIKPDGKYRLDYWCDVCAIVMFESGPCACCQEENRLRERRVEQR